MEVLYGASAMGLMRGGYMIPGQGSDRVMRFTHLQRVLRDFIVLSTTVI